MRYHHLPGIYKIRQDHRLVIYPLTFTRVPTFFLTRDIDDVNIYAYYYSWRIALIKTEMQRNRRFANILLFMFCLILSAGMRSSRATGDDNASTDSHQTLRNQRGIALNAVRDAPIMSGGPAFDSGFIPFDQNSSKYIIHNLGGDVAGYFVVMDFFAPGQGELSQKSYGGHDLGIKTYGSSFEGYELGAYWHTLNNSTITVYRRTNDYSAENIRIRIWVDPNPDWDSGWVSLTAGAAATTLNHNLGGTLDDYVVDMQQKSLSHGINHAHYGGMDFGENAWGGTRVDEMVGSYWRNLNTTSIKVYRRADDTFAEQVRVRIWKKPKASYDSGWVSATIGALTGFNHYIGGNPRDYAVDLQFRNVADGVHQRFYGGMDKGKEAGEIGLNEDDRIGAWWSHLSERSINVFRREEDTFAPEVRVRIWNFWKPQSPNYDSYWVALEQGNTAVLNHNLQMGHDVMFVDMQQLASNGVINHISYGGMDLGPPTNPDNRVGAYWFHLTGDNISVFRRNEDDQAALVRVRMWVMPRADYDSGWAMLTAGGVATVLNHNLGGDAADYLVDMEQSCVMDGVNQIFYGGKDMGAKASGTLSENDRVGAQWSNLTDTSITVYRRSEDDFAQSVRIRIWRMAKPDFDSGFAAVAAGASSEVSHNLMGNPHRYLMNYQYSDDSLLGINNCFYGGNFFGTKPPSGFSLDNIGGSRWSSLSQTTVTIHRNSQDIVADNHRIRIWRTPPAVTVEQIIDYILGRTIPDARMGDEADINGVSRINIADVIYLMIQ
jgi:hypothetical protein